MTDIWTAFLIFINNILDGILAFIDWYMYETPLFNDTLDAFYELGVRAYNILYPLLGEYILYISEHINS